MRKGFMIGLALTLLAGNASLQPQVRAEETVQAYYVSLQGDESGDGSIGSPFPSLTAARNAVRAATASGMTEDIVVYVRGGDYYLPETLAFSEQDSGKDGHTITYRNYPGESPVLHGGQLITGWQSVGDGLYRVDAQQLRFNTLYENGERSIKARYPNKGAVREGYLQIAEAAAAGDKNRFRFGSGDIPSIANLTDLEVYVWSGTGISWDSDTLGVQSVDYSSRLVTLESSAKYELGQGARYYVQGALELLDEPGEFYLDSTADQLYYRPRSLPIGNQSIVAPTTDRLIQFKGSSQTTPVANIRLQGLTLADSDFHADSPSGLVYLENAESIELADNEIRNSGGHAVYLFGWNQNHTLTGNSIHDIGYSGIQAQASSSWASRYYINKSNIISDNHIFRVGQLVGHGSGIQLIGSGDNEITHNRIHDTPRYAISMKGLPPKQTLERGTIEGKTVTAANVKDFNHSRNNLIAYNDISEANQDSMDTGMIEAWGAGLGNIIRYNRLHDSRIHFSFGFGIYLDDSTDDVTIDHNVIDHLQQSGDGSLYNPIRAKGYNNRIYDNVIADNPAAQRGAIGLSDNLGNASSQPSGQAGIARNILSNNGSTLYTFSDWSSSLVAEADYNLVYNGSGSYGIGGISGTTDFSQWQAYDNGRYDNHSEAADPLFLDAAQADYRLKVESPAYAIGISGIDTSVIGLTDAFVLGDPGESLDRLYLRSSPNDGRGYVEIAVNDSSELALFARTATGYAADLSGDSVIYSSDHPEIASVDSSGIVTGESEGIALITAAVTRGEQTHTATLQAVVGDSLTGIHIRSPRNVLEIGESLAIQTVADSVLGYRGALPNSQIAYSSQQPSVLTATSAGVLTAVGEGQSVVTAVYASGGSTYTATALVTVLPSKLARISLTAPTIMTEGETAAFTLTGQMSDGTTADLTGASIESQSVPSGVVSVQTTASSVTALAEGRTRVTLKVTLDGVSVNGFADIVVFPAQTELLPSPWVLLNYPQVQGYAKWDPNVPVRLVSNGDNIWGASDSFSYLYRAASGNDEMKRTTISAVVHSLTPTDPDAAAGLMLRDGTDADADNVNVRIIPNGGLRMTYRSAEKPQSDYIMGPTVSFPAELRLVREGDTFIGSYKKDGNWKEFGRVSVAMTNTPAAGLTLFSRTALPAEASFGSIAYAQEDLVWSGLDVKASANRLWQVGQATQISVQGITASETRIPLPGAAYAYVSSNAGVLAVSSTGEATATGYGSATVSVSTEIGGQTIAGETVITVTQPRDGYDEIQAESADEVKGLVKYTTIIGGTTPQSWARYNDVDFGEIAPSLFEAKIAVPAQYAGKTVQVRLDSPDGTTIGSLVVTSTGDWSAATLQRALLTNASGVSGVHDVYLYFEEGGAGNLDRFRFYEAADRTELTEAIEEAQELLDGASIGNQPGEYPQSAADVLEEALDDANDTLGDTTATPAMIDEAASGLQAAITAFQNAQLLLNGLSVTSPLPKLWLIGQTAQLDVKGAYGTGAYVELSGVGFTFSSSNTAAATVDSSGVVTAVGYGTTVIQASAVIGGQTYAGQLTVQVVSPRDAYATIQAESADQVSGLSKYTTIIGNTTPQSWARYDNILFDPDVPNLFEARLAVPAAYAGKTIEVRLDSPTGALIGSLQVQDTGGWDSMAVQNVSLTNVPSVTGIHDVYLTFANGGTANIDWFRFGKPS